MQSVVGVAMVPEAILEKLEPMLCYHCISSVQITEVLHSKCLDN